MKIFYVIFALVLLVCSAVASVNAGKILPTQAAEKVENKQLGEVREGRRNGGGGEGHHHHPHHGHPHHHGY
ncbi:unnamed protein product [Allacma fusca]|uniref:Phase-change related protein n=1 Tax=Allacma fusca TaxID=39272 RepID=A0A8J2PVG2_9HEXA|nr:unnamed protein product [Allacma fusca]